MHGFIRQKNITVTRKRVNRRIWVDFIDTVTEPDNLASLSVHRGFRRFVQAVANSVGLTDYIQRYKHANVRVCMEGTDEQFAAFENFVEQWQKQSMVGDITLVPNHAEEGFFVRRYKGFTIHKSHSHPASVRCRHGVVNGKCSEELSECDKITEYSADSMQSR